MKFFMYLLLIETNRVWEYILGYCLLYWNVKKFRTYEILIKGILLSENKKKKNSISRCKLYDTYLKN